jgi:hypothetical protein
VSPFAIPDCTTLAQMASWLKAAEPQPGHTWPAAAMIGSEMSLAQ